MFGGHKSVCEDGSRLKIKRRTSLTKLANMIKGSLTNRRYVLSKGEVGVENDAKIASFSGGIKHSALKGNGSRENFSALLGGSN